MKNKNTFSIALFGLICIAINYAGKFLAETFTLPLWLDSIGTAMAAYICGPFAGAVIGATVNIIYGVVSVNSYIYALTNIAVGVTIGICARKGWFTGPFNYVSISILVALISTGISLPLNFLFYDGLTGNIWGDGVISYVKEIGIGSPFAEFIGEFYVDFLDRLVSILVLYITIYFYHKYIKKDIKKDPVNEQLHMISKARNAGKKTLSILLLLALGVTLFSVKPGLAEAAGSKPDTATAEDIESTEATAEENTEDIDYNTYIQTIYDAEDGLPGGEVNDIAQTSDGILWIGTYGGLYQYDGNEFTCQSDFSSVKNVICLYTDEEGRLWIGTNDSGVSICSGNEIVNVLDVDEGMPASSIRSITQGADGYYYIGTAASLAVVQLEDGVKVVNVIDDLQYVYSLSADDQGNICAVAADGTLAILNSGQVKYEISPDENNAGYACSAFDNDGALYAATLDNQVIKYTLGEAALMEEAKYQTGNLVTINGMKADDNNQLFVCADNGIGYFDSARDFHIINTNDFNSAIQRIIWDYQGNLWVASTRLGLLKLSESAFSEVFDHAGLEKNVVNSVSYWQDQYYFGTDSGLEVADQSLSYSIDTAIKAELAGKRVRCTSVDSNNNLWIATAEDGVYCAKSDGSLRQFTEEDGLADNTTRLCYELQDGSMAIGTKMGLSFIKDDRVITSITAEEGLSNSVIMALYEDAKGTIYAGTDGGGVAVIENGKIINTLTRKEGLGSNIILRIVPTTDGRGIFFVTSNSISYMDANGQISWLDQFPYFNNYDIIHAGNDKLWITGSAGIYVIDEEDLIRNKGTEYELLDAKKGLRDSFTANAWNYKADDGMLYLCEDTGVVAIDADAYSETHASYRITLNNVVIDGVNYVVDNETATTIERGATRIEFFPKVINYSVNDPYISVQLEGFDESPQVMNQSELSSIVYTNLPSGSYTFRLAVLDNSQKNVLEEVTYTFIKEKEIYDNWWFTFYMIAILGILIIYLTWAIVGSSINKSLKLQRQEIENLRLQQTADAALAAGKAKSEFLAEMSHDIRTPINAILGMDEMILRESNQDEIYDYAMNIQNAGQLLLSLVNGILDFSKIDDGKMELTPVEYQTAELVNDLVQSIAGRAEAKKLEFKVEIDETLPASMYGDDIRVTQVISNILTNAVKYTHEGSIIFIMRCVKKEERDVDLYVEVTDTGIGIKEEDMDKLFDSFQRLDEEKNRTIEGTGLGMAIVTKLLELMGSRLEVKSVYGQGSTFSFVLRQQIVSDEELGDYTKRLIHSPEEKKKTRRLYAPDASILVVDDTDMNLKVCRGLLKGNGIAPDTLTSGLDTIEQLKKKRYDIVFLDHMMPGMDGIETLHILRQQQLVPKGTTIIALTANAINGAKERYLGEGFDDYLSKPIKVKELEALLAKYLPGDMISYRSKEEK